MQQYFWCCTSVFRQFERSRCHIAVDLPVDLPSDVFRLVSQCAGGRVVTVRTRHSLAVAVRRLYQFWLFVSVVLFVVQCFLRSVAVARTLYAKSGSHCEAVVVQALYEHRVGHLQSH